MGGWISAILMGKMPENIAGFVGIAAAPDFTEDSMWRNFTADERREMDENGRVYLPSDYGEPYVITKRMIEDGRQHLVLPKPLKAEFPVRLLQGTADADVDRAVALNLLDHMQGDDIRLVLVKGADHRFSTPECLNLVTQAVEDIISSL